MEFTTSEPKPEVVLDMERPEMKEKYEKEGVEGLMDEEQKKQIKIKVKQRT